MKRRAILVGLGYMGAQWAREVSRSSKVILTRVKTLLGENQVAAIQVQVKS